MHLLKLFWRTPISEEVTTKPSYIFNPLNQASKWKNAVGQYYTRHLFFETTPTADKSTVVYTLKDNDHRGFPSLYCLYMEENDPTEWRVAQKYLDGWSHWEALTDCSWFRPYFYRWRKEMEIRLRSENIARLMDTAAGEGREASSAARYLIEKGWDQKEPYGKKGRPSKDQVREQAILIARDKERLSNDFARISRTN